MLINKHKSVDKNRIILAQKKAQALMKIKHLEQ